ncbi:MAG: hypothetical protein KC657_31715 [Myxococcales bacterium]|nr:hypothetical protein [Myxococcales bacterium]
MSAIAFGTGPELPLDDAPELELLAPPPELDAPSSPPVTAEHAANAKYPTRPPENM